MKIIASLVVLIFIPVSLFGIVDGGYAPTRPALNWQENKPAVLITVSNDPVHAVAFALDDIPRIATASSKDITTHTIDKKTIEASKELTLNKTALGIEFNSPYQRSDQLSFATSNQVGIFNWKKKITNTSEKLISSPHVAFSTSDFIIAVADKSDVVTIWSDRLEIEQELLTKAGISALRVGKKYYAEEQLVAVGLDNKSLLIYNLIGNDSATLTAHVKKTENDAHPITSIDFNQASKRKVAFALNNTAYLYDVYENKLVQTYCHKDKLLALRFYELNDDTLLATDDSSLLVWDQRLPEKPVTSFSFGANEKIGTFDCDGQTGVVSTTKESQSQIYLCNLAHLIKCKFEINNNNN